MRISELATVAGVPVATVKYYLREGLLPAGRAVTERLAEYDEAHVRRLHLLRVLREVGNVPISRLRGLVKAVEDPRLSVHEVFARAADALAPTPARPTPGRDQARAVADQVIDAAGWDGVRADAVDRDNLAAALEVIAAAGTHQSDLAVLQSYARAADEIARFEIAHLDATKDRLSLLEEMVVGQVVFGEVLTILRRLAEEHHSRSRFG